MQTMTVAKSHTYARASALLLILRWSRRLLVHMRGYAFLRERARLVSIAALRIAQTAIVVRFLRGQITSKLNTGVSLEIQAALRLVATAHRTQIASMVRVSTVIRASRELLVIARDFAQHLQWRVLMTCIARRLFSTTK
jgi:hypothetical protein